MLMIQKTISTLSDFCHAKDLLIHILDVCQITRLMMRVLKINQKKFNY